MISAAVKLECRRMLLLDSTRVQVPVENSCALEADADLVRLHKLLVDGESGSDGKAPGHGTASSSDAKTSKALVVALLDLGGPQCLSRSEGGGFQDGGGTKVGSGGQEREAGGFVVGEMRVLLQDDVGWRGKEIEARLDVGACRANVSLDGLANLQRSSPLMCAWVQMGYEAVIIALQGIGNAPHHLVFTSPCFALCACFLDGADLAQEGDSRLDHAPNAKLD
jgi:hypothetical protein